MIDEPVVGEVAEHLRQDLYTGDSVQPSADDVLRTLGLCQPLLGYKVTGRSGLATSWGRLAPNGTNLGLKN